MRGEFHRSQDRGDSPPADDYRDSYEPTVGSEDEHRQDAASNETGSVSHDTGSLTPIGPISRRNLIVGVLFVLAALVGLYFLIPKLAGLHQTWGRLKHGDPLLLAVGAALEILSIAGYTILFRTVFARGLPRLTWRVTIEIPLAGIAAIRLFAAAGAGGVAVMVWALRRAGLEPRVIGCRVAANYAIQYSVYLGALVVGGIGLWTGALPGGGPETLTLLPALISAAALALGAAMALVPGDFERRLTSVARRSGPAGRMAARLATLPATLGSGVRTALGLVRERRLGLLGAVAYWGFDIAVLGVSFRAFGTDVPVTVVVMGYFLGTLGSLLPLPGGIGGVEGGMIGAFAAFDVPAGRAVVAVLAYRAISFWLPTLPGIAGYIGLRSTVRGWREEDTARQERQAAASEA
jgi:uncharacterized membrane protein YbhN (UPF0104 family)